VTGIATTHREAVALVRADPPSLVLADIQLSDDSSGIDAILEILGHYQVPVIFITAFPERLLLISHHYARHSGGVADGRRLEIGLDASR
jgi:CheY-like chemotaxis protein